MIAATDGDNIGLSNIGRNNIGNANIGHGNRGFNNTGCRNSGKCNTGDENIGDYNSGTSNIGIRNTGNVNNGEGNSGSGNVGNYNSGWFNATDGSSGLFNTEPEKIRLFNKPSDWTYEDFRKSKAADALQALAVAMDGSVAEDMQTYWDEDFTDEDKSAIMALPNFNPEIFLKITGISVYYEDTKDKKIYVS